LYATRLSLRGFSFGLFGLFFFFFTIILYFTMLTFFMIDIVVKKSKIHGKGVFAARDFKKRNIVLKWKGKILTEAQKNSLPTHQQKFVSRYEKNKWIFFDSPCKYVNHSCNPNTKAKNHSDVAILDITKGEEITANYENEETIINFKCNCSKNCKRRN